MRSPSSLGIALVSSSSVALLLPLALLCLKLLLDVSFPMTTVEKLHPPRSITFTLISSLMPSLMNNERLCGVDESSAYQMTTESLWHVIHTVSYAFSQTPQCIASGLLFYIAVCLGYAGWMSFCEWNDSAVKSERGYAVLFHTTSLEEGLCHCFEHWCEIWDLQ